jgi:hypothetical protein
MIVGVTPEAFIDLTLHVARTEAGIHGTVASPDRPAEPFSGWLELTAVVARVLADDDQPKPPSQ